jgi:hypothetical protein
VRFLPCTADAGEFALPQRLAVSVLGTIDLPSAVRNSGIAARAAKPGVALGNMHIIVNCDTVSGHTHDTGGGIPTLQFVQT